MPERWIVSGVSIHRGSSVIVFGTLLSFRNILLFLLSWSVRLFGVINLTYILFFKVFVFVFSQKQEQCKMNGRGINTVVVI